MNRLMMSIALLLCGCLADTLLAQTQFTLQIYGTDQLTRDTLYFGVNPAATFCDDPELGEVDADSTPSGFTMYWANPRGGAPAGCFGIGRGNQPSSFGLDLRPYTNPDQRDTFLLRFNEDPRGNPMTFAWSSSYASVLDYALMEDVATDGALVNVDMLQHAVWVVPFEVHDVYIIISPRNADTITVSVGSDWNMVSVPLRTMKHQKGFLFPHATSNLFTYEHGYVREDTLQEGRGYWLTFGSPESVSVAGDSLLLDTIAVSSGWNMVGSISVPVTAQSIAADPPGMGVSSFYGYVAGVGYAREDTIQPGKAYWVRVNRSGKLILSSTSRLR